jgi:hypothetical protein
VHPLDLLKDVSARLERAGVDYTLVGAMALGCYVPTRSTLDVDLVVRLAPTDVQAIVELFADDYYVDDLAVEEAISRVSSFNIIHTSGSVKADLIIDRGTEFDRSRFARRRRLRVADADVWVISPEDLILSKLDWARESRSEKQLNDVRLVLRRVQPLDHAYLDQWAHRLGLGELLREVSG